MAGRKKGNGKKKNGGGRRKGDARTRQQSIEGAFPDAIQELEDLTHSFRNADQDWQNAAREREEARELLMSGMDKHSVKKYRTKTGILAVLKDGKRGITVKAANA